MNFGHGNLSYDFGAALMVHRCYSGISDSPYPEDQGEVNLAKDSQPESDGFLFTMLMLYGPALLMARSWWAVGIYAALHSSD